MPEFTYEEVRTLARLARDDVDRANKCRSYLPEQYEKAHALCEKVYTWQDELRKTGV